MNPVNEALLVVLIALGPGVAYLTYVSKASGKCWMTALMGGSGWFLAFILRTSAFPLLKGLSRDWSILALALLAGFLEESVRYFLLKSRLSRAEGVGEVRKCVESFGSGWGLTEALIVFGIQTPLITGLRTVSLSNLLAGSIERNTAIILHLTLTFLIGYGIITKNKWFLAEAIFIHSATDLLAGELTLITHNVWLIELSLGLITLSLAAPVITLTYGALSNQKKQDEP